MGAQASANPITVGRQIIAESGIKGLYRGIDSALFRQITYGTARLGIFKSLSESTKEKYKSKS